MPCSNAAKTRNPLKFAGVPQTGQLISAASRPKFTILWGHVEDILLLNKFCVEVWQTSNLQRLRLGEEKKERKRKNKPQDENIMVCPIP